MSAQKLVGNEPFGISPQKVQKVKPGTPEETLSKLKTISMRKVDQ